jgi:Tol biopolymer transport system component
MSSPREVVDRVGGRFPLPDDAFDRLARRRGRKRRGQRIRAGAVGLAIAIGVVWLGANLIRSFSSVPADESRPPAPSLEEERVPPASIDWDAVPGVSIDGDAIIDIRTGEVTPLPVSITSFRNPGGYAVAPVGDVLLFEAGAGGSSNTCGAEPAPNRDCQIFVTNVDGTNLRQLTDASEGAMAGDWSPDGTKIVAVYGGGAGPDRRDADLVLVDVATGETTRLASGALGDFQQPHFSSDGQLILFSRFTKPEGGSDEGSDVFGIPVEGGDVALVFEDRWNATFSPDGRAITYGKWVSIQVPGGGVGGQEVWLADADGSHPRPLVPNDEPFSDTASWSPDGTRIVFTKWRRDSDELVAIVDEASGTPTFSVFAPEPSAGAWIDDDTLIIDVEAF